MHFNELHFIHLQSSEYIFLSFIDHKSISKTPLVIWTETVKKHLHSKRHILHQTLSRNLCELQSMSWHLQSHPLKPKCTRSNCFKLSLKFALRQKASNLNQDWHKSKKKNGDRDRKRKRKKEKKAVCVMCLLYRTLTAIPLF